MKRKLGNSGIITSALGMGCWPAGGIWNDPGRTVGWHGTSDQESLRAMRAAMDHGITLFDTADTYSSGHSEVLLGQAIKGRRDKVTIATKFGYAFEEGVSNRHDLPTDASPAYIRRALDASLRRLDTNYIDLYQLHVWGHDPQATADVIGELDRQVAAGRIRGYGWSTDQLEGVRNFSRGRHAIATQIVFNVFEGSQKILDFAEGAGIAALARSPLAMGLLSGKYGAGNPLPADDVRATNDEWIVWFRDGRPTPEYQKRLEAVRDILCSGGRSLVQGAIAWLWARSPNLIPIPGSKTEAQAIENARAMEFGPLPEADMRQVAELTGFRDATA